MSSFDKKTSWFYSETVKDHFFHPRNFLEYDPDDGEYDVVGCVGSPACGDEMKVWLKINDKEEITDFKWRTFGCGSAIASTSMLSVMILEDGVMSLKDALSIKPQDIMERLGGLPARKFHCSVLCDQALREAISKYYRSKNE